MKQDVTKKLTTKKAIIQAMKPLNEEEDFYKVLFKNNKKTLLYYIK